MNPALEKLEAKNPDWRVDIANLYDQGASDREIMREVGLTPHQFKALYDDMNIDFRELVDLGRMLAGAWWEAQGRKNLFNSKFNTTLWKFNIANRLGWSEKTETSNTNIDFSNMDDQSLMKEIEELNKRLALRKSTTA